jgi:hypothetical protein
MDDVIGYYTIEVETVSLNDIRPLHIKNKSVRAQIRTMLTRDGVSLLSLKTPRHTFVNLIGMKKDRHITLFYYKFTQTRPNLIPIFCRLIGRHLEENECAWIRDACFDGDILITPDEIIGDQNLPLFYTRPREGKA